MPNHRHERINDATAQTLSVVLSEVHDPRIAGSFVSITGAEVSRDLKYAKVFWSALGADEDSKKEITKGLKSCTPYLRRRLAEELNLRITPELTFAFDTSFENGAHISSLLHQIEEERRAHPAPAEESEAAASEGGGQDTPAAEDEKN